jgi:hypothetical protein
MFSHFFKKVKFCLTKLAVNFFPLFMIFLLVLLVIFNLLFIFIPSFYFYVLPAIFEHIDFFNHFLSILTDSCFSINEYNNFNFDVDSTVNTDGEDSVSYLNDFVEISLQERFYFFD